MKRTVLNFGFMIPQYSQAGMLNEMRMLSTPATVDNATTSGKQEDYASMGYDACRKAKDALAEWRRIRYNMNCCVLFQWVKKIRGKLREGVPGMGEEVYYDRNGMLG